MTRSASNSLVGDEAAFQHWGHDLHIPICFETMMRLEGFHDASDFAEFVQKAARGVVSIEENAIAYLYETSKGEPVKALQIAWRCWKEIEAKQLRGINRPLVVAAAQAFWRRWEEQRVLWERPQSDPL